MRTSLIIGFFSTLIFGVAIGYFFGYDHGVTRTTTESISSFEECKAAGYPILEKYPEECRTPDGKQFVQSVSLPPQEEEPAPPRPIQRPNEPVACTMDAKICPDGSAVGRVGPNCEFAPCPGE